MTSITIDERDFRQPSDLMDYLKEALGFPAYFGGNLNALNDCLGDICRPTRIDIIRRSSAKDTWFDRATLVIARASLKNEQLRVRIRQ